jgi:hypothetical protein
MIGSIHYGTMVYPLIVGFALGVLEALSSCFYGRQIRGSPNKSAS